MNFKTTYSFKVNGEVFEINLSDEHMLKLINIKDIAENRVGSASDSIEEKFKGRKESIQELINATLMNEPFDLFYKACGSSILLTEQAFIAALKMCAEETIAEKIKLMASPSE